MSRDGVAVQVDGLRQFRRELGRLDRQLPKDLAREFKQIGERVAADARQHVPVRTGRARSSIRATTAGTRAYVAGGKKAVPYYAWLDFGGGIPNKASRRRRGLQRPWQSRPVLPQGRYLYPAVARARGRIDRDLTEAFERARTAAFGRRVP